MIMAENVTEYKKTFEYRKMEDLIDKAVIDVSQEEIGAIRDWLYNYYHEIGYKENIQDKVNEILEAASKGWEHAPRSFFVRVKTKIGQFQISRFEKMKEEVHKLRNEGYEDEEIAQIIKRRKTKKDVPSLNIEKPVFGSSFFDYLHDDEKLYWIQREKDYRREFDFNESSDKILLEQLLFTETMLFRIRKTLLTGEGKEEIKNLKESSLLEEHKKISEKLGLLRIQRIQNDINIEGNVGEITLALEEKLLQAREISDKKTRVKVIERLRKIYNNAVLKEEIEETIEEMALLKEAEMMGDINIVPQAVYESVIAKLENRDAKKPGRPEDEESGD